MIRYCLPVIRESGAAVFEMIAAHEESYAVFEVWLDYIDPPSEAFVEQLLSRYPHRVIFLFRRLQLETPRLAPLRRHQLLEMLSSRREHLVDLDLLSQGEDLWYLHERGITVPLLLSYHHYQETPSSERLRDIITRMDRYAPLVYKVATYCTTERDAIRLLELTLDLRDQGKRFIVLGMGPHGAVTRVFGSLWGNELLFAPPSAEDASAPNQLTRQQLHSLFEILNAR
jgi:3-dehydroquinate dehydratase type I